MSEARQTGSELSIGRNNARYARRFPCYITYMNDATQTSNLPASRRNTARVLPVASIVLKGQNTMTIIFLATDSTDNTPICFSNIGTALEYVRDSHADLNAEGAALMLQTPAGLMPATNKAVKASNARRLCFSAAGADAASVVAGVQSKLDGALAACRAIGIDPGNVAKVADLATELEAAQALVGETADAATFEILVTPLHKRGYKN